MSQAKAAQAALASAGELGGGHVYVPVVRGMCFIADTSPWLRLCSYCIVWARWLCGVLRGHHCFCRASHRASHMEPSFLRQDVSIFPRPCHCRSLGATWDIPAVVHPFSGLSLLQSACIHHYPHHHLHHYYSTLPCLDLEAIRMSRFCNLWILIEMQGCIRCACALHAPWINIACSGRNQVASADAPGLSPIWCVFGCEGFVPAGHSIDCGTQA